MCTGLHVGTVGEIRGGDLLAPFQFDGRNLQKGLLAAGDEETFAVIEDLAWDCCAIGVRHRLAEKVAGCAPERGVGAWPWRETAHAVVDDLGGLLPVDQAVLLF